jgi:hypothetical protein
MQLVRNAVCVLVFGTFSHGVALLSADPLLSGQLDDEAGQTGHTVASQSSDKRSVTPEASQNRSHPGNALGKGGEFEIGISPEGLADIVNNKMRTVPVSVGDEVVERLSHENQRALVHLVRAARHLNKVFLRQDHPDNLKAYEVLKAAADEEAAAQNQAVASHALKVFRMFNGLEGLDKYSGKSKPLRIFTNKKLHPGKGFYPQDLTKQELVEYIQAHPEQTSALLGNNTIVVRSARHRLEAIPYSVAFREDMEAAAWELMQAAGETDHKGLKEYLQWQAQALVNDSDPEMLYRSDSAWINLEDTPLEFTIGRESYYDRFSAEVAADPGVRNILDAYGIRTKSKDSIGVRVGIVNFESARTIADYREHLVLFSKEMPLNDQYKQYLDSNMTFADVDLVAMTGTYTAERGGITRAQNLPNDDKLAAQLGVGKRLVFHRQIRQSEDPELRRKILDTLVNPSQHGFFDVDSAFLFTIGHELTHALGPRSTRDGRNKKTALGKYGDILEESKADMGSIVMADYLVRRGYFRPEQANKIYLTWMVRSLPKWQPSSDEAHRFRSIIQLNYFREKGALAFEKGGKLTMVPEKIPIAASDMLTEVIRMQLEGNRSRAETFVKQYGAWNDVLEYAASEQMKLKPTLYRLIEQPFADWLSGKSGDGILPGQ